MISLIYKKDKNNKKPSDLAKDNDFGNILEMLEDKKGFLEMCNVKPPIKPLPKSRRSILWFFFLYFSTHIVTYFVVFPCILLKSLISFIIFSR